MDVEAALALGENPLSPHLKLLAMVRGAEAAGAAGEHQEPRLTTVRTADHRLTLYSDLGRPPRGGVD